MSAPQEGSTSRVRSEALWQPRDVKVGSSVAEYSRFVHRMKIGLPVAAGVIVLLVLLLPQLRSESERFRIGLKDMADVTTDTLSMVNARYFGTDENGQPFSIVAESVRERPTADKLIDLTGPRAEIAAADGSRVEVTATAGVYDRGQEVLELTGEVSLRQQEGYEMHTSVARVQLKDNVASGDAPVKGTGPVGEIAAAGFIARQEDNVVVFTGPATLVLKGEQVARTADPAPEAQP
jgi:lipopolysaccharide export system protein LptC